MSKIQPSNLLNPDRLVRLVLIGICLFKHKKMASLALTLFFVLQLKIPKGIPAGGIKISVVGKNLAYIQNPQMYVYHDNKMFTSVSILLN